MNDNDRDPEEDQEDIRKDDSNEYVVIRKEDISDIARVAVSEQYHTLEFFRESYKKFIQKRKSESINPFVLKNNHIENFNEIVVRSIGQLNPKPPINFACIIKLKNRREINFHNINDLISWRDPEKSYPVAIAFNWSYTYRPLELEVPIPLTYSISIQYTTQVDHVNRAALSIEEFVTAYIEGPTIEWIRSIQEEIESQIELVQMPIWWRLLRKFIVNFRPFFNNGIYYATLILVWFGWVFFYEKDSKATVANNIFKAKNIVDKLHIFIKWWANPSPMGKLMIFYLIGMVFAGGLHLLIMNSFDYFAPPSIIGIGLKGKQRINLINIYGTIWLLVIGGIVGAIVSKFI